MSKGSLFWGNGRGKLGESVFYRAGGEQRNRTYIKKIKNPKTIAQMTQRILTLNPISMFKNMKPVISESFTERKANQSSYNKFVQENSSAKKFFITKAMLEQNLCVPYGAVIAKGSLGLNLEPQLALIEADEMTRGYAVLDCIFNAAKVTDFTGMNTVGINALQGETLARVLRQASVIELPTKFSLVIVEAVPQEFELESGDIVNPWKLAYKVMHFDGNSYTEAVYGCPDSSLETPFYFIPNNTDARPSADNAGMYIARSLDAFEASEVVMHPMGIILSFEEDGVLKVSNSVITSNYKNVGTTPVRGVVNAFLEGNAVYREAMNQYGYSAGGTLNAASLAPGTCYIEFTGATSNLRVNGAAVANGDFKVGDTLVFSTESTDGIALSVDGEVLGVAVDATHPLSWVVPNANEITIFAEQELP